MCVFVCAKNTQQSLLLFLTHSQTVFSKVLALEERGCCYKGSVPKPSELST